MNRLFLFLAISLMISTAFSTQLNAQSILLNNGDGSSENPLTVEQVLQSDMNSSVEWVRGYVVGAAINSPMTPDDPSSYSFEEPYGKNTNILISDNPNETDVTKCIPVELSASYRPLISIDENPDLKNKRIDVQAKLQRYYQVNGLKGLTAYTFPDETIVLSATKMNFGGVLVNQVSESIAIEVSPYAIDGQVVINAPSQFQVSLSENGDYSSTVSIEAVSGEITTAYFRFAPNGIIEGDINDNFIINGITIARNIEVYGFAGEGDALGSEERPYVVSEVRDVQGIGYAWGEGYIVGIPDDGPVYYWESDNGEWMHTKGLILAESPNVKDPSKVILIRLTDILDTDIRGDVNLQENPELYGSKIKFGGLMATYYGVPAIITIDDYSFNATSDYIISFNSNGGSEVEDLVYTIETETFALSTPTKDNFTFVAWYNNAALEGSGISEIEKGSTGNLNLYAKWETATSIDDDSMYSYTVYPNPFTNTLFVDNLGEGVQTVQLLNIAGSVIAQENKVYKQISFDTNNYYNGVYFVKITKEDGTSTTIKVIKQ